MSQKARQNKLAKKEISSSDALSLLEELDGEE